MIDDDTMIPAAGYSAWLIGRDGEPFALPVVALVRKLVCYGPDGEGKAIEGIEWEPVVITAAGSILEVCEIERIPAFGNGVVIGVVPSNLTAEQALAMLETVKVMPDAFGERAMLGAVDDEDMVGRVTAARMRLNRRLSTAW